MIQDCSGDGEWVKVISVLSNTPILAIQFVAILPSWKTCWIVGVVNRVNKLRIFCTRIWILYGFQILPLTTWMTIWLSSSIWRCITPMSMAAYRPSHKAIASTIRIGASYINLVPILMKWLPSFHKMNPAAAPTGEKLASKLSLRTPSGEVHQMKWADIEKMAVVSSKMEQKEAESNVVVFTQPNCA